MSMKSGLFARAILLASAATAAGIYGCGGDTEKPAGTTEADAGVSDGGPVGDLDADSIDGSADAPGPDVVTCPDSIVTGSNKLSIGTKERTFLVDLPSDTSKPAAVVFSWHGFGDTAANFRKVAKLNPNQDPAIPAIIVTPDDSGISPPLGLDWDIAKATPSDKNVDIQFFDAMLECLQKTQSVDESRIYSFGFSAGAVVTNMLYSRYPKRIAAIVTASGAWMNDKAETDLISIKVGWSWPALDPADRGNVLMTHGGPSDVTVLNILDLERSAQAAIPFLKEGQRTVIDCAHTKGHALHPEVDAALMTKYLFAHKKGEPSPFAGSAEAPDGGAVDGGDTDGGAEDAGPGPAPKLDGYPDSCTLRLP